MKANSVSAARVSFSSLSPRGKLKIWNVWRVIFTLTANVVLGYGAVKPPVIGNPWEHKMYLLKRGILLKEVKYTLFLCA